MSSTEGTSDDAAGRDEIAAPDPTAGQAGDGPTQAGATNPGAAENAEGEGADKSTDR